MCREIIGGIINKNETKLAFFNLVSCSSLNDGQASENCSDLTLFKSTMDHIEAKYLLRSIKRLRLSKGIFP